MLLFMNCMCERVVILLFLSSFKLKNNSYDIINLILDAMIASLTVNIIFLVLTGTILVINSYRPVIITSEKFLEHKKRNFHPERPERLLECFVTLKQLSDKIVFKNPSAESDDQRIQLALNFIRKIHDKEYVLDVETKCKENAPFLSPWDTDTYISRKTFDQCVLAQSAWIDGVDIVLEQKNMVFALTRPPGHHATKYSSMGFCIFNFAVGAATYAIENKNVSRVCILDFDVVGMNRY